VEFWSYSFIFLQVTSLFSYRNGVLCNTYVLLRYDIQILVRQAALVLAIDFWIFLQTSPWELIHQRKHDFTEFFTVIFLEV